MEIRLVRSFVAVAETGSFGAAAERLRVTQPALTKQLQQMERKSGLTLFVRGRHGAVLTAAGRLIIEDAVEFVRRADEFDRQIRDIATGARGPLTIGFGMSAIDIAPQAVAVFRTARPSVDIQLEDMSSAAQFEALKAGRLSVGFVRLPAPRWISVREIHRDRLAVAMPVDETPPAGNQKALSAWLDNRPLIRLIPSCAPGLTAQTERLFAGLDCRPLVQHQTSDLLTILALVAAGVGSAVVPASAKAVIPDGVRLIPIEAALSEWAVGVAWAGDREDPLVLEFLAAVTPAPSPGPLAQANGR